MPKKVGNLRYFLYLCSWDPISYKHKKISLWRLPTFLGTISYPELRYTIFSNNLYYVFQQHISNIPTNKKGWIIYLWHTLFAKSDTQLILSYNIILKLIIPILQPFGNIFPIFHKALFLLFLVQITIAKIPPVNIYNQNSYTYKFGI